jgi:hypothetical protein
MEAMFLRNVGWLSRGYKKYISEDKTLLIIAVKTSDPNE